MSLDTLEHIDEIIVGVDGVQPAGGDKALTNAYVFSLACALVLTGTTGVCEIPMLEYLALCVYPGIACTLLRSFAKHRAEENATNRSVIVDAAWPLALLFLKNLRWLQHPEPGAPWYRA